MPPLVIAGIIIVFTWVGCDPPSCLQEEGPRIQFTVSEEYTSALEDDGGESGREYREEDGMD